MAVDLIDANNTRYYSVPDDASLTFPDSDWFIYMWTQVDENSGTAFQYLFSNNGFEAANSLNIFLREASASSPNEWRAATDATGLTSTAAPGADSKKRLIVIQRNGSNLEMFFCEPNATATNEDTTANLDGAINGGLWNIGRRVDGNSTRYYEEHFGDVVKGSVALTQSQIELIARGVSPIYVTDPSNLDVWFQFHEATATVVDIIGGNIATRQGSGLLTSEHFPVVGNLYSFIPVVAVGGPAASLLLMQQSFRQ